MAKPYRWQLNTAIIFSILLAVIVPIQPYLIGVALDQHVLSGNHSGLLKIILTIIVFIGIQSLLFFSTSYLTSWLGQSVIKEMRLMVYKHINMQNLSFFNKTPVGSLTSRNISDIQTIADFFSSGVINIIGDILQICAITFFMFYTDWKLSLLALSVLPLLLYSMHVFRVGVKSAFTSVRLEVSNLNTFVQEHINGMSIVQLFGKEKEEYKKFDAINQKYLGANKKSVYYYAVFFPVIDLVTAISLALIIWFSAKQGFNVGTLKFGVVTSFIMYVNMFFRPLRMLADRFNTIQMGMVAAERIFDLTDDSSMNEVGGTFKPENIAGFIAFKNLWFAYNNEDWVLKDINFSLKSKKTLALVGATGAGKSSIINLISRFFDNQKGEICVDGKGIKEYDLQFLRQNIAVVLQDVFLFSGSIFDNVKLNQSEITDVQVIEASKKIGAHEFIKNLPGGYNYKVMERGQSLSHGQRQLISFIRALVQNPSVLILDEATSSIDTETEIIIQNAIKNLMKDRTSIVIAHRLSTIQHADEILVLDNGEIIESGNHDELLTKKGTYFSLYESQS